jgi:hypothetical protein
LVTPGKHVNNTQVIARQLLGKRVPEEMNTHATVKVLLDYISGNSGCQNVISKVNSVLEKIIGRQFCTGVSEGRT